MKKIHLIGYLFLALCFFQNCADKSIENTEVKLVTADEMRTILDLEDVQLIDVRSQEEYDEIHIANSQNIDFTSPTFDEDISKLDKKKPVILYCKGGGRSAKCAKKLKDAGFEKIFDLEGGLSKWQHSDKIEFEVKS